jgi:hypothetical protein
MHLGVAGRGKEREEENGDEIFTTNAKSIDQKKCRRM